MPFILAVQIVITLLAVWRLISFVRKDPRQSLEALGVFGIVAGGLTLAVLLPDLHERWRDVSFWRGLAEGFLLLVVPLIFSRNRLALVLAAAGFCAIRLGIAGLIWLARRL